MSASVDRRLALVLMIGVALVPACMKRDTAKATTQAGSADQGESRPADPLAELEHLEGRMRELGLAPATTQTRKQAEEKAHVDDALDKGADSEAAGVPTEIQPMPAPTATTVERDDPNASMTEYEYQENRCTTVCALNEAICELEVQICSMAKDHGSDPIYADACERAVDDCELSGDACDTCVE